MIGVSIIIHKQSKLKQIQPPTNTKASAALTPSPKTPYREWQEKERAPRRPCRFLQFTSHCPYISPMFLDFIYILTHCGAWLIVRLPGFCSHIVDRHCYCFLCYLALAEPLAFLECILLVLHHSLSLPSVTASFCLINKNPVKIHIHQFNISHEKSTHAHFWSPYVLQYYSTAKPLKDAAAFSRFIGLRSQ